MIYSTLRRSAVLIVSELGTKRPDDGTSSCWYPSGNVADVVHVVNVHVVDNVVNQASATVAQKYALSLMAWSFFFCGFAGVDVGGWGPYHAGPPKIRDLPGGLTPARGLQLILYLLLLFHTGLALVVAAAEKHWTR